MIQIPNSIHICYNIITRHITIRKQWYECILEICYFIILLGTKILPSIIRTVFVMYK